MGTGSSILDSEKTSWKHHSLCRNSITVDSQRDLLANFKSTLRLGYRPYLLPWGFYYVNLKQYVITDGTWVIEFGSDALSSDFENTTLSIHSNPAVGLIQEKEFELTADVKKRIQMVCGMRGYSLCLRNSEHVARYIQTGSWVSLQVVSKGAIYEMFSSSMTKYEKTLINTFPQELIPERKSDTPVVWEHMTVAPMVSYRSSRQKLLQDEKAFRVVVLGPTGCGKSAFINAMFNKQVADSKESVTSVTRQVDIYEGHRTFENGDLRVVHIFDCLGFCDAELTSSEVLSLIKQKIKLAATSIDAVVVLVAGRIEGEHQRAIQQALDWLQFKHYPANFTFLYNKSERLDESGKLEALANLRMLLKIPTIDHVFETENGSVSISNCQATVFDPLKAFNGEVEASYKTAADVIFRREISTDPRRTFIPLSDQSCVLL